MSRMLVNAQINLIKEAIKSYVTDPEDYENPFFWVNISLGSNTGKTDHVAPYFVSEAKAMFDPSEILYISCTQKSIDVFQANNDVKGVHALTYDKCADNIERLQHNSVVVLDDFGDLRANWRELCEKILEKCLLKDAKVLALG